MTRQQHEEGPAAAWGRELESFKEDRLADSANELGLQAFKSGSAMGQGVRADAVPSLVTLLSSPDTKAQEHAVSLLAGLSESSSNHAAIIAAGAIPTLVDLLRSNSLMVQASAAMTLFGLADKSNRNRAMIISAGAIPLLNDLCDSAHSFVQLAAAVALFRVAADSRQYATLLATHALPILIGMLRPRSTGSNLNAGNVKGDMTKAAVQDSSVNAPIPKSEKHSNIATEQQEQDALSMEGAAQITILSTLKGSLRDTSYRTGSVLQVLLAAGVPEAVVTLLNVGYAAAAVQVYAIELFCQMMSMDKGTATNIAAAGAIQTLLPILQHGKAGTYEPAATALYFLVEHNNNNKAAFVREGGLDKLKPLLGVPDNQMPAVQLLDGLVSGGRASSSILSAAVSAGVIEPLVQLLQPSDMNTKQRAMSVLCTLARHSSSYQTTIRTAGAIPELVSMLTHRDAGYISAVMLLHLVQGNTGNKAALAAAGGIEAIIKALCSYDARLQEDAAQLLLVLINSEGSYQSDAIAAGAIPALVAVLKGCNVEAQIAAAGTLGNLAIPASYLHNAAAMGNQGMGNLAMLHSNTRPAPSHKGAWHAAAEAVPVLVTLLKHTNVELVRAASAALGNMFNTSSAFAQAFEAADGLTAVVSMLNSGIRSIQVLALLLLRNYNKCTNFGNLE